MSVATLERSMQGNGQLRSSGRQPGQSVVQWLCGGRRDYFANTIDLTPAIADELLQYHNHHNRTFYKGRGDFYGNEMKLGYWKNTSGAIGIDVLEQLTNGQHRIAGVVYSGVTIRIPFVFNCDKDARAKEDCGKTRSEADRLSLSGTPTDQQMVASARAFLVQPSTGNQKLPLELLSACLRDYGHHIAFADSLCTGDRGGLDHAIVIAAIARASIHLGQTRMEEFAAIARSGIAETPDNQAAAKFGKWLTNNPLRGGGGSERSLLYRYTQGALRAFMERRSLSKLYAAEGDVFPLPAEAKELLRQFGYASSE